MDIEELKQKSLEYANSQGFKLQLDEEMLNMIITGLLRNKDKHGEIYCPCRRVVEDKEENKKIICPCVYHKEEIEQDGQCKCRLFLKK